MSFKEMTTQHSCSSEVQSCISCSCEQQINPDANLQSTVCCLTTQTLESQHVFDEDCKLGARSKRDLASEYDIASASESSGYTESDWTPQGERKQRLYQWREAGQALRSYLTRVDTFVSQSSATSPNEQNHPSVLDSQSSVVCSACWNAVNSSSSVGVYKSLKQADRSERSLSNYENGENSMTEDVKKCQDAVTQYGSNILPLFDELREKLSHLTEDREWKKTGVDRKHRQRRQLGSFSISSSSDDEAKDYCQPIRRKLRQSVKQSTVEKSKMHPSVLNDLWSSIESDCTDQQQRDVGNLWTRLTKADDVKTDLVQMADTGSYRLNNCQQHMSSQHLNTNCLLEIESKLCLADVDSSSTSTSEISDSDTDDENGFVQNKSNDFLMMSNCRISSNSVALSCLSTSGSECTSPFQLLCSDQEPSSVASAPADTRDPILSLTSVSSRKPNEFTGLYQTDDLPVLSSFVLPSFDVSEGADNTSIANGVSDLAVSDDDSFWDLNLENIETEADDEFECDCPVCLMNRDRIQDVWQTDEFRDTFSTDTNNDNGLFTVMVDEPDYMNILSHSDVLESLFQDVILQMLQVYPDLFNSQTPPALSADEFNQLKSFRIVQSELGSDTACAICLCPFEDGEDAKGLPCRHSFHTLCIQAWLNKAGTCPVCRGNVRQAT